MQDLFYLFNVALYPFRSIRRFVAISLAFIIFLAVIFPIMGNWRESERRRSCSANQRHLWLAMQMYLKDSDGVFPLTTFAGRKSKGWKGEFERDSDGVYRLLPIAKHKGQPVGWVDALIPYYYSESLLACPSDPNYSRHWLPYEDFYTDYYMNSNLSKKYLRQLLRPEATIVIADGGGNDVSDATYAKSSIPAEWVDDKYSPANRHRNGAMYLMADGTSHWLTPDEATHFGNRKNAFAVR